MGDEMLSVFYSGDIFPSHTKMISAREVASLKVTFDEKSEFRLFRDYFGLIRLVQNASDLERAEPGFDSLYDFTYTKRSRVDSMGSDHSLTSSSSGGNSEIELCIEASKTPPPSLAPGAPTRVSKRNIENSSDVANRNRKNRESKKNRNANVCVFCRNNGESKKVYSSHVLKDAEGNTTCPILRAYTCPLCKASGNESHTIKYCPKNKAASKQQQQQNATAVAAVGQV
ncbi:PREDICTED: uncharacterized protein LOC107335194 [Acropora digitifera]|uniref:uncharacterized protein LOC107335194 n=1 Tax=Acropora digitifera TaxID=70779 RepID=UPI00077B2751|nr:PREDICTED: uncharacterized protein LOC107335194 [Acropora digitifera]XP_029184819.1 uncharacterized protein LOC114952910 [Acropora millepora]